MATINNFSNRELQRMDIHQLRLLARQVGVPSPTSKKKGDLIDQIIAIVTGEVIPDTKNINRGRPAKHFGTFEIGEMVTNTTSAFSTSLDGQENNQYAASVAEDYVVSHKIAQITGVVTTLSDGVYLKKFKFADTSDDAKLDDGTVVRYRLKENDIVTYAKQNGKVLIIKANGMPVEVASTLKIANKTIEVGKRNILFIEGVDEKKQIVQTLAENVKVVLLPSNNIVSYDNEQVVMLEANSNTDQETLNNFYASVDIALFYKKSGHNVALVVDNFLNVISAIKQFDYRQTLSVEKQVFYSIQKLMDNGVTFVGLIPASLKSVFTSLGTSFDNIN